MLWPAQLKVDQLLNFFNVAGSHSRSLIYLASNSTHIHMIMAVCCFTVVNNQHVNLHTQLKINISISKI